MYEVELTHDAEQDLILIDAWYIQHASTEMANGILDLLENAFTSLSEMPDRGHHPSELIALGILDYRELICPPHKIIYKRIDQTVFVYLIIHERQDFAALLQRRLLGTR